MVNTGIDKTACREDDVWFGKENTVAFHAKTNPS